MMTITRYRYITKHLCLLLLLIVGVQGARAKTVNTGSTMWDFTTESTSLTYKDPAAWTSKYNGYQCKLLDGDYEGLALQQVNTWTVTSGTGLSNNGPGQRGIVVVNLEEGDHVKVEYTLNGYSGFTTYGNRSEEEIGETNEAGNKYRVYRMTADGDFALWIPRASVIRKITVIKFKYTEKSKAMTKGDIHAYAFQSR